MKTWPRHLIAAIAVAAIMFSAVAGARAETVTLELKRLEPFSPADMLSGKLPDDYMYRMTTPQVFSMRAGSTVTSWILPQPAAPAVKPFAEVINKEPEEYRSEQPFRGVARLGADEYGFVLDLVPPKPDANEAAPDSKDAQPDAEDAEADSTKTAPDSDQSAPKGYCALYFDLNHNGDLTDDEVVEAEPPVEQGSGGYSWFQFPRVDITLDVEGAKVDYAFFLGVSWRVRGNLAYATATLTAAAYREGKITLGGRTRRIVLLDFNSNGRFDDEVQVRESESGRVSPVYGDLLMIDPDLKTQSFPLDYSGLIEHQVAKATSIDGEIYDLEVSPGGDRLTLEPCSKSVGHVELPSDGFTGMIYGDKGVLQIQGDKSKPIALPSGDWKLISYTIDLTGYRESAEAKEGQSQESSLLEALTKALMESVQPSASKPRPTQVSAYGVKDSKVMKIREGETIALPYGPPYKPVVTATSSTQDRQELRLGMSLVGSGGELCRSLLVDGSKPAEPTFTIATAEGEEIASGKFKWG